VWRGRLGSAELEQTSFDRDDVRGLLTQPGSPVELVDLVAKLTRDREDFNEQPALADGQPAVHSACLRHRTVLLAALSSSWAGDAEVSVAGPITRPSQPLGEYDVGELGCGRRTRRR
jgi:hypothetical protein